LAFSWGYPEVSYFCNSAKADLGPLAGIGQQCADYLTFNRQG